MVNKIVETDSQESGGMFVLGLVSQKQGGKGINANTLLGTRILGKQEREKKEKEGTCGMEKGEQTLGGVWQEPVTTWYQVQLALDLRGTSSETVR